MGEVLAYFKNIQYGIFLNAWFIEKETSNNKTWISSDLPTQEEFENLCFVAVDLRIRQLWVLVYSMSKMILRDRFFLIDFAFVCSEES